MDDSNHSLWKNYACAIGKHYHRRVGSDKNPLLSERAAMKINKLGIDYGTYMDVAVRLCGWAVRDKGWPYPYYTLVISDGVINKIGKMMEYTSDLDDDHDNDVSDLFESELSHAMAYIDWWFGKGDKPVRGDIEVPAAIKHKVAEYICRMYGIPYMSSNYNKICQALETAQDG